MKTGKAYLCTLPNQNTCMAALHIYIYSPLSLHNTLYVKGYYRRTEVEVNTQACPTHTPLIPLQLRSASKHVYYKIHTMMQSVQVPLVHYYTWCTIHVLFKHVREHHMYQINKQNRIPQSRAQRHYMRATAVVHRDPAKYTHMACTHTHHARVCT